MLVNLPLMPDYAYGLVAYSLASWRYMAGAWAWGMASDYGRRTNKKPDGAQKLGGIFLALMTFPVAPVVWMVNHSDRSDKTSSLFFPDPRRERVSWRDRRNQKLEKQVKERDARIKQLESEAGI